MQLLGVSTALATVGAACRKPNEKIVPFVRRPEEMTPGNPLHFATAYALEGFASGLLVTSHDGRPTKIEGNPDHPETLGATTAIEQALILGLYDDDRAKLLRRGGETIAWRIVPRRDEGARRRSSRRRKGAGLRFLVEPSASPLLGDLRRRILARFPMAKFVSYSSTTSDGAAEGPRLAFGQPLVARHHLDKAQVILSLDADFLGEGPELRARDARLRGAPRARPRDEPPLRRRAGPHGHGRDGRPPAARCAARDIAELRGRRSSPSSRTRSPALAPLAGLPKSATVRSALDPGRSRTTCSARPARRSSSRGVASRPPCTRSPPPSTPRSATSAAR